ncbi:uncharacterized protein LOC6730062 [Drosophila simulans]|uniref:GD17724 n=1 Tax=Drosophila simulans TaxID=7240 RepID=B4R052_DROSI|nr:uncharacterized protein LOC6730062 [Drosophila simulans]EDX14858.1 GD17724 [Drosophila simulans]KMZ06623.1 uncharacterized protein Dsimw501_GD17724 [Drosophila simulans]
MSFKAVPLLLAIGAVFVAAVPTPVETERESSLVKLLLSSPAMRSDLFNVECVDYYSPLLKGHVDKYNEDFTTCKDNYDGAFSLIDSSYRSSRDELSVSVRNTCLSLLTCNGKTSNSDAFDCLASGGPLASKELEKASYKASDNQTSLLAQVSVISDTLSRCQIEAYRTYNTNHGECYADMVACLGDPDWEFPSTSYVL